MNPLTLVKRIQKINSKEAALGISDSASWHAKYKESAYVFVGGIPYDLTEGDLLAVFAQYGEIVDVNLVRDKGTGKSKGFAFVAYEDQRSTNLAVDNLNGAQILGRIVRVDHVSNYKKKEEEDEEEEQKKREARGVCYAFQKGECNRGSGCKFSHDEQRNRNTGWGPKDSSRWDNDRYDGPLKNGEGPGLDHKDSGSFREKGDQGDARSDCKRIEKNSRIQDGGHGRMPGRNEKEPDHKEEWDMQVTEERSARDEPDLRRREDHDRKGRDNRSTRDETESYNRKDYDKSGRELNRLARNRPESNPREDRNKRGREVDRSAWEGTDHDRSKGCDRSEREEERSRRHESGSYAREDRDQRRVEKRVAYERSPRRGR